MAKVLKLQSGLVGLMGIVVCTPTLAERSVELGLVTSSNSSLYKDADQEHYLLPLLIAEYDRFYLRGVHGGYRLFQDHGGQSLALEVRHTFDGYSSDDSDALAGMDDRDPAWEAGLAYEKSMAGGQARIKLMQDISDTHKGFSTRVEYERPFWTDDTLMLSWYTGSEYWNSRKTDYYFGVSREEATSRRPVYTADESYSFFLGSNLFKRINERVTLIASAEYLRLSDTVDESPLTGRQDQWSAYAGVFYQF